MTVRFIDESSNFNVEVHLRPITPTNIIRRPEIVWRTKTSNQRVRSVYLPKVVVGYHEQDGKPIIEHPKLICPSCNGSKRKRCPDCNGQGKVLVISKVEEANLEVVEKSEEPCPTCNGKGKLNEPCPMCKATGIIGYFTNYEKMEVDEEGNVVATDNKVSYEVKPDGTESAFPVFTASDTLVVRMRIPKSKLDELYTESWAELEATTKTVKKEKTHDAFTESELYRYAEELVAKNEVAVGTNFVKARGFQIWNFVAYPTIYQNGTFGFLVGYWQAKKEQTRIRPIPKAATVAEEQKIPTKSYLPDIEALLK